MQRKLVSLFLNSAGVLLLSGALALLIANLSGAGQVQPRDPIFSISVGGLFWIVGAIALMVAMLCLFGRQFWLKAMLVLWLALNGLAYWLGCIQAVNHGNISACLTGPARTFGITPGAASGLLALVLLYLLLGSASSLLWLWWSGKNCLKMVCAHCGGHLQFRIPNLGRQIPCPHCKAVVTLRKPDENLKMSCFFCHGHIEFPAHAIGEKMACPHCKMDITLKEPA